MQNFSSSDEANFFKIISYIERLHRRFLDLIKQEIGRLRFKDINSVQALLVFNISDTELTAGELRVRGYYLGSNVSYNLKKLVEGGYMEAKPSSSDKRVTCIKVTPKGKSVAQAVSQLCKENLNQLVTEGQVTPSELETTRDAFRKIETIWNNQAFTH